MQINSIHHLVPHQLLKQIKISTIDNVKSIIRSTEIQLQLNLFIYLIARKVFPAPNTFIPHFLSQTVFRYITQPIKLLRIYLTAEILPCLMIHFKYGARGSVNISDHLLGTFLEELVFRYLIQTVLLNKKINHSPTENNTIVKVSRVIFTASVFALAHIKTHDLEHSPGGLAPQFGEGIILSWWRENNMSIARLTMLHFIYNSTVIVAGGGD